MTAILRMLCTLFAINYNLLSIYAHL
jgi:hypothetical protein